MVYIRLSLSRLSVYHSDIRDVEVNGHFATVS